MTETTFTDDSGDVRFSGKIRMGGTAGQVATVQANGTLAPAAGGGSQPLQKTLTAAEITARWDGGAFYSTVEWPEYTADTFALIVAETVTTLDGDLTFDSIYAYDPGASTADVLNNGIAIAAADAAVPGAYATTYTEKNVVSGTSIMISALATGKAAYIVYVGGTTPPTTGSATIRALRLT